MLLVVSQLSLMTSKSEQNQFRREEDSISECWPLTDPHLIVLFQFLKKLKMAMNFGCAGDPDIKNCAFCGEKVQLPDKLMVDREIIHKNCFNCCFCGAKLKAGFAAMELSFFNRFGPRWYCSGSAGQCALIPVAQKDAKLKERGLNVKKSGKCDTRGNHILMNQQ